MNTIKITFVTLFLFGILYLNGQAQSKIDYSIRSNVLDPDTLKKGSVEHKVFWKFVKLSHKQAKEMDILTLKDAFEELGITTKDKEFDTAYSFFKVKMKYHKRSVEQWEHFKDLTPGYKKPQTKQH